MSKRVKPKIKKKPVESEKEVKAVVIEHVEELSAPVEAKVKDMATITWINMTGETSIVHVDVHSLEAEVKKILGRASRFTVEK